MAKRHKNEDAEPEEEYEFVPEEFDEDAFIHKEMVSFHTTVTLFLAGIIAALLSWGAFAAVGGSRQGWLYGLLILGVAFLALRTILRVSKIDIEHWGRREWLGTGFLMFFAWLAFFIMFINPPISDFADPDVIVYMPGAASAGDDVRIDVFFTDNGRIEDRTFSLSGAGFATFDDLTKVSSSHYQLILADAAAGTYTWSATATDSKGGKGMANGTLEVAVEVLDVFETDLLAPTDTLVVKVPEALNLYAVYADVEGGGRVYFEHDDAIGGWKATSNFAGWKEGSNNITITAEEKNRFQGPVLVPGGLITSQALEVQVADAGDYTGGEPKRDNPTVAPVRNVPGFELPLLLAGLVGIAVIARRR